MKVKGIGNVAKKEILSVLTKEGQKAVKDGTLSMEEAAEMYKGEMVKRASKIGAYGDTYAENRKWIPEEIYDKLSPEENAFLVDAFHACYHAGKNAR